MLDQELLNRFPSNPILCPKDIPYPCDCVLNPGATTFQGETLLLLRIIDLLGSSHLTVAKSKNGYDNWRIDNTPLLAPSDVDMPYEVYGCEDSRIVYLDDRQEYVITYTGYSPLGAGVCIATTKDFISVQRYGLVLAPNNKDAALFPRKIGGRYWMLHRPALGDLEHIWLAESSDLIHWGHPWCIIKERGGPWWDGDKVGAGPPPIETPEGWLIIYHGVKGTSHGPVYRMGLALLDLENPRKVIRRLKQWVFGPREGYELTGFIPGVVFPTGAIVKGDEVWLYYGAADTCTALAIGKVQSLIDTVYAEGEKS